MGDILNLFELFVKIGVDDQASGKLSNLSSKLGNGLKTAAKIGTAAVGAAAAGITALTTAAVNNYAEYEQLVGGVETLFKNSANKVQEYAANAYKTAGMSANEYMSTVTSFSASLLQSLDGDTNAAAEKANLAITDMSDNASKMGTDMELIQNAYRGFAKSNYTMLDNLALGYGGTKEEMQRLLDDAEKLSGQKFDISSYGDIVDAIHVVQTEMGITGTTAKEASSTISGSVSSMKSAWSNLVTGIADDNADFETLIKNFVESVGIAAGNILPRIEQSLIGVGDLITSLAPVAVNAISDLIEDVLPSVLKAGISLLTAVGDGIISNFDYLVQTAFDLILYLSDSLISGADGVIDGAVALVESLAMWIEEYSGVLIEKAVVLIMAIVRGLIENLPKIAVAALKIIRALALGIVDNIPEIVKQIPTIISSIVNGFSSAMPDIVSIGKDIVKGVWSGISSMIKWFTDKVKGFFSGIVDGVKDTLGIHSPSKVFAGIGGFMAEGLADGWDKEYNGIKRSIEKDLNFGAATVDFSSSGLGVSSAGIINGVANSGSESGGAITVNLMLPDGTAFARYFLPSFIDVARADGTPILNPL